MRERQPGNSNNSTRGEMDSEKLGSQLKHRGLHTDFCETVGRSWRCAATQRKTGEHRELERDRWVQASSDKHLQASPTCAELTLCSSWHVGTWARVPPVAAFRSAWERNASFTHHI